MEAMAAMGGLEGLREIVNVFIDRVRKDVMIGFFFDQVDIPRLKELELQFAARHLGAGVAYQGRPLHAAHAAHHIFDGQFNRRLQILREVLEEHAVPEAIREGWLAHNQGLRVAVTRGECLTGLEELCRPGEATDKP